MCEGSRLLPKRRPAHEDAGGRDAEAEADSATSREGLADAGRRGLRGAADDVRKSIRCRAVWWQPRSGGVAVLEVSAPRERRRDYEQGQVSARQGSRLL